MFSEFGNKALELGATQEELEKLYKETEVPKKYSEKLINLKNKKLGGATGPISRTVLKSGYDIEYLKHNGYALTLAGKEAMRRNGRKWTIGYKTNIILNNKKFIFNFDAITDEGSGPTFYRLESSSDTIFKPLLYDTYGVNKFTAELKKILKNKK